MRHRLRLLGLASTAALFVLGLQVSTAWGTYDQALTGHPASLAGSQVTQNVGSTVSGPWKCEKATFAGSGIGTMEAKGELTTYAEITVHPVYEECRAFGLAATVNTEDCNYIFATATTTETAVTGFDAHAVMTIECEPGHKIVVNANAGGCVVEIGAQTTGGVVAFKNESNGTITWQWTIEGIKYHQVGNKCTGGTLEPSTGTMTGTVNIGGIDLNTAKQVAVSVT